MNHELSVAITKGLIILGYMELPEKDQPDESIWNHPELLEEWFEQVKLRRENPGKEIIPKEDESDWMQNELTLELKKGK